MILYRVPAPRVRIVATVGLVGPDELRAIAWAITALVGIASGSVLGVALARLI